MAYSGAKLWAIVALARKLKLPQFCVPRWQWFCKLFVGTEVPCWQKHQIGGLRWSGEISALGFKCCVAVWGHPSLVKARGLFRHSRGICLLSTELITGWRGWLMALRDWTSSRYLACSVLTTLWSLQFPVLGKAHGGVASIWKLDFTASCRPRFTFCAYGGQMLLQVPHC